MLTLFITGLEESEIFLAQKWENLEIDYKSPQVARKMGKNIYFFVEVKAIPVFNMQSICIKRIWLKTPLQPKSSPLDTCSLLWLMSWALETFILAFLKKSNTHDARALGWLAQYQLVPSVFPVSLCPQMTQHNMSVYPLAQEKETHTVFQAHSRCLHLIPSAILWFRCQPIYKWESWGSETLSNLPKVT